MKHYKAIFQTFPNCTEDELRTTFSKFQFNTILNNESAARGSSLASAKGIDINPVHTFADRRIAEGVIQQRAERGGCAIAVKLAERDPETGSVIDPATGERRMVWLVGANCPIYDEVI